MRRNEINKDKDYINNPLVFGGFGVVRLNLMTVERYTPYCGETHCYRRLRWDKNREQFKCTCGYITQFPKEFIDLYKDEVLKYYPWD